MDTSAVETLPKAQEHEDSLGSTEGLHAMVAMARCLPYLAGVVKAERV